MAYRQYEPLSFLNRYGSTNPPRPRGLGYQTTQSGKYGSSFSQMQPAPVGQAPVPTTQALGNAVKGAGLSAGLGAAGSLIAGNPIGAIATAGQGIFNILSADQERKSYRKKEREAKERARKGDPAAKEAYRRGLVDISGRQKLSDMAADRQFAQSGGPGRGLARTLSQGNRNRAVSDLMGATTVQDAQYRNQARQEEASYGDAAEQAKANTLRAAGGAFGLVGQFAANEATKGEEQKRYNAAQALRERGVQLQEAAFRQGGEQFDQSMDMTREQLETEQRNQALNRQLEYQRSVNEGQSLARAANQDVLNPQQDEGVLRTLPDGSLARVYGDNQYEVIQQAPEPVTEGEGGGGGGDDIRTVKIRLDVMQALGLDPSEDDAKLMRAAYAKGGTIANQTRQYVEGQFDVNLTDVEQAVAAVSGQYQKGDITAGEAEAALNIALRKLGGTEGGFYTADDYAMMIDAIVREARGPGFLDKTLGAAGQYLNDRLNRIGAEMRGEGRGVPGTGRDF